MLNFVQTFTRSAPSFSSFLTMNTEQDVSETSQSSGSLLCNKMKKRRRRMIWGPYLSERQWGTVREDRSPCRDCWNSTNYENSRSTSYLSGEDGMFGITDCQCSLCFALCFYNGEDSHVKERLFGLSNPQGNHGEDVKEIYFYLTNTPQHNYMKAVYVYPVMAFPYEQLIRINSERTLLDPEYELWDTEQLKCGWWEISVVYVKRAPDDVICTITCKNKSKEFRFLSVIPTVWFRNFWSTLYSSHSSAPKPSISKFDSHSLVCHHDDIVDYYAIFEERPDFIFTENDKFLSLKDKEINKDDSQPYGAKCYAVFKRSSEPNDEFVLRCHLTKQKPNVGCFSNCVSNCCRNGEKKAKLFFDEVKG